ncbi:MAG: flavodoxin family protein [Sulfuriferula sp.]
MKKRSFPPAKYTDLRALFINTTLQSSSEPSHTEALMAVSQAIMKAQGVTVEHVRASDYVIAPGVQPDMTQYGFERDDWPQVYARVKLADILVLGSPIWLGERSSICSSVIERLYAQSADMNDKGQYVYYGKVGGCIVTGNEDGIKNVSKSLLYALQHLGYTIPPQADAGWIGEAGPGPSYGDTRDDGSRVGFDNEFTQRNTTFMTWNLLHLARILKDADGIPAYGNQRTEWEAGNRFDHPNPEYR